MKNLIRKIKMKIKASEKRTQSADPITAYKARLEIGIYTWLLDLIEKELEAEEATDTVTEIAGAQVA